MMLSFNLTKQLIVFLVGNSLNVKTDAFPSCINTNITSIYDYWQYLICRKFRNYYSHLLDATTLSLCGERRPFAFSASIGLGTHHLNLWSNQFQLNVVHKTLIRQLILLYPSIGYTLGPWFDLCCFRQCFIALIQFHNNLIITNLTTARLKFWRPSVGRERLPCDLPLSLVPCFTERW